MGELLLTTLIALLVFGPERLPALARHLGKLIQYINRYKQEASRFFDAQKNEQILMDNINKANAADKKYLEDAHE